MPGSTKKELYIAKSVGQLNEMAELPSKFKSTNAKLLVKTADKMLKEAQHSEMIEDEERAYVLFMKYFNVVTFLKKSADYKKQKSYYDDLLGSKNLLTSINKAEELSTSLKERYDQIEAEIVANKLATLDRAPDIKQDKVIDDKPEEKKSDNNKPEPTSGDKQETLPAVSPGIITCSQFYDLIEDRDAQLIIMDVRSIEDFQESRVNHKNVINVPGSAIKPGTTVTYIEKSLPMDSTSLWKQRGNIDHIVLMDWNSSISQVKLGTTLQTLKYALYKYDSTVIIKSKPLILDGGYEQWMLQYPTKCINPVFDKLTKPIVSSTQNSLMDFDYPDFEETFMKSTAPSDTKSSTLASSSSTSMSESSNGDLSGSLPRIDRSTKPKVDRSTKANVTSIQISKSKPGTMYPDVSTYSSPGTSKALNGGDNFTNAASRAAVHSTSVTRADDEDIKNSLNAQSREVTADLKILDDQKRQKLEEIKKLEEDYKRMQEKSRRKIKR